MDSIIFDLDGTLWDSSKTVLTAWNEILRKKDGINELTVEDLQGTMGLQMHEIGKKLFPSLDDQAREQLLQECGDLENVYLENSGGILYDSVEETLEALSEKYKLYIVSNCQEGYIETFYKYHQLEKYFLDFENPGRTGLSKGENIKLIMERNSLSNPVYVGDTEGDLKAARYAGIPFVYATYGFGKVEDYDFAITSFAELKQLF
ncbi:HAD family hydrolase [Sutcliffiella cohnii]|uniref:HAD family hydrolase n=1 Tax=Sutcliffiella sp. NC1 TaxID=3004096 RepID=UPI0022DDE431|nr:HAD family hydrolase [Sutcliffiella sp. NC1]WBL13131.1 HAD family hydrolase [Sutcliffiella sp. NC1]